MVRGDDVGRACGRPCSPTAPAAELCLDREYALQHAVCEGSDPRAVLSDLSCEASVQLCHVRVDGGETAFGCVDSPVDGIDAGFARCLLAGELLAHVVVRAGQSDGGGTDENDAEPYRPCADRAA